MEFSCDEINILGFNKMYVVLFFVYILANLRLISVQS